MSFASQFKLY